MLIETLYGEGGEFEIPQEELEAYYETAYRRVILLAMPKLAASEEELAEMQRLFGEYYDRARGGEEMRELVIEEYARETDSTI